MLDNVNAIDQKTLALAAAGVVIHNYVDCKEQGVLATIEDDPLATGMINALDGLRRRLADFEHETPEERVTNMLNDARQALTDLLEVKGLNLEECQWLDETLRGLHRLEERQLVQT